MDVNGDGYFTMDKINTILSSLGELVKNSEVDKIMAIAGVNGEEMLILIGLMLRPNDGSSFNFIHFLQSKIKYN